MNILQICANYPPILGGHGIYAQNLSLELSKMGVNTCVLTFNPINVSNVTLVDKLPVTRVNALFLNSIEYPIYDPTLVSQISKIVKNNEIDVINSHTRFFTSTFFAALYRKLNKDVLLVHTEHGAGPLVHKNKLVCSVCNFYDSTIGKWSIQSADVPIAIGPSSKRFMQFLGCHKDIEIIPNSINCSEFEKLSQSIDKSNESVVITYIGRLVESKGLSDLIHVFSEIEKYYDVKLLIVGKGPDEYKFRQLVSLLKLNNVEFLGFRSDIANILSLTDIFVSPSHYDSVPTTILEAGCLGTRVVVSNIGDVSYIVGNDYPYLYNVNSLETLRNHLVKIIEESDFKAKQLQERIYDTFNWDLNSKKYFDLLMSQMNN
jgi:glycosyltransferase involved in cell wall biosynthesis